MVTTSDLAAFQQQLRQEMTDVIQHSTAESVSNLIPRNWEDSNEGTIPTFHKQCLPDVMSRRIGGVRLTNKKTQKQTDPEGHRRA